MTTADAGVRMLLRLKCHAEAARQGRPVSGLRR